MPRTTMANLISRVRLLINDQNQNSLTFSDDDIQNVLDESREDLMNMPLIPKPTFSTSTIQYLDYWSDYGGWEDGYTIKQYLTIVVTPSLLEPIPGHFQFSTNTWPPLFISGSRHDVYRAAGDLLERWAAKWVLSFDLTVNAQSFRQSQASDMLTKLANQYRRKQRPRSIGLKRSDVSPQGVGDRSPLSPTELDYMSSGGKS